MTLFGPDGSHWQAGITIPASDWDRISFILWRASIGTRSDASFARIRNEALGRSKPICAYHFVYPTGRYSAAAQAATFDRTVGDHRIPAMLDWESDGSLEPTWDDVLKVADAIRATGHSVKLVYTGHWYWQRKGSPTMSGHGMDMVNANYGGNVVGDVRLVYAGRGGDSCVGWHGYGGLDPVILQFGSQVLWAGVAMDMNAYRGDPTLLHQWFYDPAWHPARPDPDPIHSKEIYHMIPQGGT